MNEQLPIKESWTYNTGISPYETIQIDKFFLHEEWNVTFNAKDGFLQDLVFKYQSNHWSTQDAEHIKGAKRILNEIYENSKIEEISKIFFTEDEKIVFKSLESFLDSYK